jgi:hypothetical protein
LALVYDLKLNRDSRHEKILANGHYTVSAGNGKVSGLCKPVCPAGNNGTPNAEDNPGRRIVGEKGGGLNAVCR